MLPPPLPYPRPLVALLRFGRDGYLDTVEWL